jgi:hypothetical protein
MTRYFKLEAAVQGPRVVGGRKDLGRKGNEKRALVSTMPEKRA